MKRLLVLLALLCASCAIPAKEPRKTYVPIVFHADTEFTWKERLVMNQAALIWRLQTRNQADIRIVYDLDFSDRSSLRAHVMDDVIVRGSAQSPYVGPTVLAYVMPASDNRGIQMLVVPERLETAEDWLLVTMHEFGHALGVMHEENDKGAVMYPYHDHDRKPCLTETDVKAFCDVNGCDWRPLPYC